MNRRRLCWVGAAFLLLGSGMTALYLFSTRDSDFYVIGKKTRGTRANLATLEAMIDTGDFRDCKTVQEALNRLYVKLGEGERGRALDEDKVEAWIWLDRRAIQVNEPAFDVAGIPGIRARPIHLPTEPRAVTVKQFLRTIFREEGAAEVRFIVRWNRIEATTAAQADVERTRYLESVSIFDRMRDWWKELHGEVENDPPFPVLL